MYGCLFDNKINIIIMSITHTLNKHENDT
jgi:hypothetical protein